MPSREEVVEALLCPFPPVLNSGLETAQAHSVEWVAAHGLLEGEALHQAKAARIAWMIAGFYPTAEQARLNVASDYLTWAYSLDDVGDESETGHHAETLLTLFASFEEVFAGAPPREGESGLVRGLRDVVARLRPLCTESQIRAFHEGNRAYWGAMLWEAKNREDGTVPSEEVFLTLRPAAGAVPPFFALIEPMEQIDLPAAVRGNALFAEIGRLVGRVMCVINDVLSHRKERAYGDVHNLVMVFEAHRGLELGDAVHEVVRFTNGEVARFNELAEALIAHFPEHAAPVARHLDVYRAMMRVTLDWTFGSSRYHGAGG
ncbi:MAG: hypothetical protein AB8I08_32925 [Sandaracinaceae bacterium]